MNMADTRRLPVPVTDIWDWQMRGACRGMDSALFFHPGGGARPGPRGSGGPGEADLQQLSGAGAVPRARAGRARALRGVGRALGVRTRRHRPRSGPHPACPEHAGPATDPVLSDENGG